MDIRFGQRGLASFYAKGHKFRWKCSMAVETGAERFRVQVLRGVIILQMYGCGWAGLCC